LGKGDVRIKRTRIISKLKFNPIPTRDEIKLLTFGTLTAKIKIFQR
jgi:hypothetical protein